MADPKITVLMPVYNNEKFLRESVDSILNQTFKDFEFIIINDGSTDRTKKILNAYKDFRIRVIDNDKNIGITRSLNKGLGLAKGEYIARMDGDDISLPERLERQVKFLENNPKVVLLGNWVEIIDGDGNLRSITRYPTNHCFITWIFLFKTCLAHPTVMYRKKEVLKINGYNSMLSYTQDYDLWVRLSKIGKIGQIPEVLLKIRRFVDSIEDRHREQQLEIAGNIAFHYAKSIMNEINDDIFVYFFKKTKDNNLTYQQIKEIVSLTKNIKKNFFNINNPDHSCRKQIEKDIQKWFSVWAVNNWRNPLIFFYMIFSMMTIK
jgi:glycosyltransferase involved in cell wall biosynthesis